MSEYKNTSLQQVKESLARSQLTCMAVAFTMHDEPKQFHNTLDKVIKWLTENEQVKYLAKSHENSRMLACLCVTQVVYICSLKNSIQPSENVGKLLSQWLDKDVDAKNWESVDALVDYLYGPTILALYRHEVENDYLGRHLWETGVPLLGRGVVKTSDSEASLNARASTLPMDLS